MIWLLSLGYYRVNYDLKNWHLLVKHLNHNHTSIHVLNRAQILDDVFNLARAGFVPYSVTLRFTQYLPQERDHVPWTRASRALQYIGQMFRRTPAYGDYEVSDDPCFIQLIHAKLDNALGLVYH